MENIKAFWGLLSMGENLCSLHIREDGKILRPEEFAQSMAEVFRLMGIERFVANVDYFTINHTPLLVEVEADLRESDRSARACISRVKRLFSTLTYLESGCNRGSISTKERLALKQIDVLLQLYYQFVNEFDTLCEDYGYDKPLGEARFQRIKASRRQIGIDHPLPADLTSPAAKVLLDRAVEAGYLTAEYQWIEQGHTRYQQAYLADRMSAALGIASKWRVFGRLWSYEKLSQRFIDVNNGGCSVANKNEIDQICDLGT
ncbi:MAG: hypothetical protein SNH63_02830 [Rikenellaceae bacterium]